MKFGVCLLLVALLGTLGQERSSVAWAVKRSGGAVERLQADLGCGNWRFGGSKRPVGRIVFSAIRCERDPAAPNKRLRRVDQHLHLWLVNADGTGREQLTHGDRNDDEWPTWSPDGHRVLFARTRSEWVSICVVDPATKRVRTIYRTGEYGYIDQLSCSPDGRLVAAEVEHGTETKRGQSVYVLDVSPTGQATRRWKIVGACDFAWSPDSKRLYVGFEDGRDRVFDVATGKSSRVASPVWGAVWLDNDTIFGTVPEQPEHLVDSVRAIRPDGTVKWQRKLQPSLELLNEFPGRMDQVWHVAPNQPGRLFLAYHVRFANGGDNFVSRVELPSMKTTQIFDEGRWCGVSPSGDYVAAAQWYWVTDNISDIRVGPIKVLSTKTGKVRDITWPLGAVLSGDWR